MKTNMHEETFKTYGAQLFDYSFIKSIPGLSIVSLKGDEDTINVLLKSVMAGMASYIINDMIDIKEGTDMFTAIQLMTDSKEYALRLNSLKGLDAPTTIGEILDEFYTKYPDLVYPALVHSMDKTMTPIYILAEAENINVPTLEREVNDVAYYAIFIAYRDNIINELELLEGKSIINVKGKKFPVFNESIISVEELLSVVDERDSILIGKFIYENIEHIKVGEQFKVPKNEESDSNLKEIDSTHIIRMDPTEMDYLESDNYHGNVDTLEVKVFDVNKNDFMPRLALQIEIQKSNTYKIEPTVMDERRNVMIELERLFKRDYPESTHFLENRVQGMSLEELKDMLSKLS